MSEPREQGEHFSFQDAPPAADMQLDELFPNPELAAQQPAPATPEPAPPQPAAEPAPFLKTATGTIYKSAEDAIRGTEEKDRVIAELRQKYRELEGRDPLKKQPQAAAPVTPAEITPESLFDELAAAAGKGDKRAYMQSFAKATESILAPYAPLLAEVARERAIRSAEARTPGVREFYGSDNFKQVTERIPLLRDALSQLENDPRASQAQLDQLFELAKLASDGLRVPELVRGQQTAAAPPAQIPPRPTLQNSTPTTPTSTAPSYRSQEEMLRTPEGRKELIERYKSRTAPEVQFEQVGL